MKTRINALRTLLVIMAFFMPAKAYADITVTPAIVVFDERDRFKEVTLLNTTNKTNTYEVFWSYYKMVEGQDTPYLAVEQSITDFDLADYVVYTPRRVTIAPSSSQKIRLALRRPAEVPPGEYRAHLTFKTVKGQQNQDGSQAGGKKGKFAVGVNITLAFSIPVIFNAGTADAQADIESLQLSRNQKNGQLQAIIPVSRNPEIPYGVLGHLLIYNAKNELIGEISNANIFSEINKRIFRVPLIEKDIGNQIRVALKSYDKTSDKIYAEKIFPIQ